jgi:phosphatidate cytidylyltransferase
MGEAQHNLLVRTLSGAVFAAVMIGFTLLSAYTFLLLLLIICAGSMWEFYRLAEHKGAKPQKWVGMIVGALAILAAFLYMADENRDYNVFANNLAALAIAFVAVLLVVELIRGAADPMSNVGTTLAGLFYVALPMTLLCLWAFERDVPGSVDDPLANTLLQDGVFMYNPNLVLAVIIPVWANDIGAYLAGSVLGRHKLWPRISPKKSWEGLFGGLLFAAGAGFFIAWLLNYPLWAGIGMSLILAVGGVLGDFIESMFKRSVSAKDSGHIMPGHGGFLDRFDALLFAVLLLWIAIYVLPVFLSITPPGPIIA